MFSQTLLLLLLQLLVVHKVSRSAIRGNIYAFYFDKEHLYRFSPCRTFMVVGHLGTFGAPLNVRHFFSKFDSEYFSLIIFLKYLFILLLIMISFIIMTLLEKNKICRTFRAVGHLGTLQTSTDIRPRNIELKQVHPKKVYS